MSLTEIEPYNDCKKCKKLVEGQRKILLNTRNQLINVLVKYHEMVEEFNASDITKFEDIDILKYFDKTKEKQKVFINKYNNEIKNKNKYLVMYKDGPKTDLKTILTFTSNVEDDDNLIIKLQMDINEFKKIRNMLIKKGYLEEPFNVVDVDEALELIKSKNNSKCIKGNIDKFIKQEEVKEDKDSFAEGSLKNDENEIKVKTSKSIKKDEDEENEIKTSKSKSKSKTSTPKKNEKIDSFVEDSLKKDSDDDENEDEEPKTKSKSKTSTPKKNEYEKSKSIKKNEEIDSFVEDSLKKDSDDEEIKNDKEIKTSKSKSIKKIKESEENDEIETPKSSSSTPKNKRIIKSNKNEVKLSSLDKEPKEEKKAIRKKFN